MSPHLSIWRWHITMATSILHRVTGCGLYLGGLIGAAWAVSLAAGPETYELFLSLMGSPLGLLVMLGMSACAFYHLANGIRHLVWDFGYALDLKSANSSGWAVFGFTIAATAAAWAIAIMSGAL